VRMIQLSGEEKKVNQGKKLVQEQKLTPGE
jgi:hypothetical protein